MATRTRPRPATAVGVVVVVAIVAAVLAVLLQPGSDRPGRDGVLEISVHDFHLTPATFVVEAEEPVTLRFVSESQYTHNLAFGREVIEEDGQAIGFGEDLLGAVGATADPRSALIAPTANVDIFTLSIKPGATVSLQVTFPEDAVGDWQVGCFIGSGCDYRVGPAGELTIE